MSKLSVIVSFDVTEPHLQYCLDSLSGQALHDGDIEVVLSPVAGPGAPATPTTSRREAAGDDVSPGDDSGNGTDDTDDHAHADTAADGDATAADEESGAEPEKSGDEGGEDSESADAAEADALATARAFAADPPSGVTATLLPEPAPAHTEARERGGRASGGDYLVFVHGGDALTGYALTYLADALDTSGSDVATGNVYRFNDLGVRRSSAHRKVFTKQRTGVDIRVTTSLMADRLHGNKMWRRSFWEKLPPAVSSFTDADADLAVVRALFAAQTIDVLTAPVLLVRDRESGENLSRIDAMTRRIGAIAALADSLSPADRALWDDRALRTHLRSILLGLDDADDDARRRYYDHVGDYLAAAGGKVVEGLPALHRLNYHLVRTRQDERVLEAITFQKSVELKKAPVVRRGLNYFIRYPFFEDEAAGVPRGVYRMDSELRVRQKTESVEWRGGKLVVGGRIGILHLRAGRRWQQQLVAFAVNSDTGRRVRVPVKVRRAAEYRLPDVPNAARHDFGGFEITVDPTRLRLSGQWRATDWKLELVVLNRGLIRRRIVGNPVAGPPQNPGYLRVHGDVWIRPAWNADSQLSIAVAPVRARVAEYRVDYSGERPELEITGEFVSAPAASAHELRLTRLPGTARLSYPLRSDGPGFTVRVPAADLIANAVDEGGGVIRQEQWAAELVTADGGTLPVVLPDEIEVGAHAAGDSHHEVAVHRTSTGHLRLRAGWARPAVHEVAWSDRDLVLSGHYAADAEMELVFKARGRDEEHVLDVRRAGTGFRAVFTPAAIPTLSGELPLPAGGYQLWGRVHLDDGTTCDVSAECGDDVTRRMPLEMTTPQRTCTFEHTGSGMPVLRVGSDLWPEERGAFAQRRLREEVYPVLREDSVREEILFDSYTGRQVSDSPHSIYAELRSRGGTWADYPMSWLVKDGQVNLPDDVSAVRHNGRDFYEALARSKYLVTNSRQPAWFTRRPDQVVVQTWHGSMLKRIGFDIENIRGKSRDYHEKLAWETKQWDYLVSPSPWATPILRRAFRFDGEILETGYPRNDIFFSPEREAIAERTRRRLGLPADKKVVLYAPTWRDDKYYTRGKHKLDLHLDLRRMYEKLGDDHVLLVRRHPRVVDSVPIVGKDFVYDVSLYPEIMELFLITDVLVTDYSSMMFDFANTGRPMLFFTYDIESYRDNLRGFYFDFEETAPGPLLVESDDVIASLLDIDEVAADYSGKYRAFTDRFCPLDDGHAAARVVDRVFGDG
ncbi:CDP-glycerol glycerophosphotransferase [Nocardiopsis gilva YIM 90087]|uniref:CDP-glycerol glycerophosphotransferase n=1 Tax=Nocardiopsis gilva YIM 90087 TaxID=1235441 RepID=A0A223S9I5_9ACTN|nr:CDP-glycerol:glycerophosphate glycerophosphotransferase [Nocardiopsis gilva]ASU84795.1 CDP-glycerol glycerophosphotransferase [Nocardiopsis gilva YIM 90087]